MLCFLEMFIYGLISFMYWGGHDDMPSRYPPKETLVSAPASSSKIMPFPEQPTFMADGRWRYNSPALWAQCGLTLMSCAVDQSSRMLCTVAQILLLPVLLHRCWVPKHSLIKHCTCWTPFQSLISGELNRHRELLSLACECSHG